ncbi:hypothetical protein [Agromyces sp. Soil535]|uniref:hypothetical protein n=1 Tax=Agromyces sp. Soil535 TaxID=1736390 RepID=UPI000B2F7F0D|nr:hypothetical protein [Agromyces sp. Soil535]
MSRHTTVVDFIDGFDDVDEHDIDLLVDLLGLAGAGRGILGRLGGARAGRRRP